MLACDITADRSLLLHHARLNELRNFRTPRLDLESLYAAGPIGSPYLYDLGDPDKFLLGINDRGKLRDRFGITSSKRLRCAKEASIWARLGGIVAEVLLGLIDGDPSSYRNAEAGWKPGLPSTQKEHFTMADLLRYAGAV